MAFAICDSYPQSDTHGNNRKKKDKNMRTKTLALSALLGMLGTASLVAQTNVYSLNAVGYINLSVPPGFSIIACQLQTGTNTVGSLLNNVSGAYNGAKIYKWIPANKGYDIDTGDNTFGDAATGWDNAGIDTMNPGEALWFDNPNSTAMTITFVGTVPQGTNNVSIPKGFSMISSPVPFSGDVVTNMGLQNYNDLDKVYAYIPANTNYQIYNVDLTFGSAGYNSQWDPPGDPQANVGQGFWYDATSAFTWSQVFSVNP
jgi:hypothetical protein